MTSIYVRKEWHHSSHQPLETIFKKPLSKSPRRLQSMMLKLQQYQFTVRYKKGKELYVADTLSRAAPTILSLPPCWPFNVNVQSDLLCKSPALIYVLLCWNAGMCKCEFWGARACELHIATNWGTASCVSLMPCLHETRFREINAFHNSKMWRSTVEMLIYLN